VPIFIIGQRAGVNDVTMMNRNGSTFPAAEYSCQLDEYRAHDVQQ
jgi:hypothetical protein